MLQQRQRNRDARNAEDARRPSRKAIVEIHGQTPKIVIIYNYYGIEVPPTHKIVSQA
jgi:hypothetical protein